MPLMFLLFFIETAPFQIQEPLYTPVSLKVDAQGQLWILDQTEAALFRFKADGQLVSELGRKGQGPSEFNSPSGFDLLADGRIVVADSGNRRLQFFDAKGAFLKMIPINDHNLSQVVALPDGSFILTESNLRSFSLTIGGDTSGKRRFHHYTADGTRKQSFGAFRHHDNPLLANLLNHGAHAQKDGRLLFASAIAPQLIWYEGDKEKVITYPTPFQPEEPKEKMVTREEKGEMSVSMEIQADLVCFGMSLLRSGDILILRATGPAAKGENAAPSQLLRLRPDGTVGTTYPGTYKALMLAASPDDAFAYLVMEDEDDVVIRVAL